MHIAKDSRQQAKDAATIVLEAGVKLLTHWLRFISERYTIENITEIHPPPRSLVLAIIRQIEHEKHHSGAAQFALLHAETLLLQSTHSRSRPGIIRDILQATRALADAHCMIQDGDEEPRITALREVAESAAERAQHSISPTSPR